MGWDSLDMILEMAWKLDFGMICGKGKPPLRRDAESHKTNYTFQLLRIAFNYLRCSVNLSTQLLIFFPKRLSWISHRLFACYIVFSCCCSFLRLAFCGCFSHFWLVSCLSVMGGSTFLSIESKTFEFSIEEGGSFFMLRIVERGQNSLRYVLVGRESARRFLFHMEELLLSNLLTILWEL